MKSLKMYLYLRRELRVPECASGEDAAGKATALHREVFADGCAEIRTAEYGVDDLLVEVHPDGFGSRFRLGRQLRTGDFHTRRLFELLQR